MTAPRFARSAILTLALFTGLATVALPAARGADEVEKPTHATTEAIKEAVVEHGGAEGTHAEGEAKPNLLGGPSEGLITGLTTLIVFGLLVFILGKYAWGPISGGLKAREDKIRKDIADAEAARAKAEATLREYTAQLATAEQKIRDMLAKATADAEGIATNVRARAQQEAEETKEKAQRDIEAARDQALGQIHSEAVNLATNIAEKILQRNLNPDDQRDLLARSLEQLQTISRN